MQNGSSQIKWNRGISNLFIIFVLYCSSFLIEIARFYKKNWFINKKVKDWEPFHRVSVRKAIKVNTTFNNQYRYGPLHFPPNTYSKWYLYSQCLSLNQVAFKILNHLPAIWEDFTLFFAILFVFLCSFFFSL